MRERRVAEIWDAADMALDFFRRGRDTAEIAREMRIREAEALRLVTLARNIEAGRATALDIRVNQYRVNMEINP